MSTPDKENTIGGWKTQRTESAQRAANEVEIPVAEYKGGSCINLNIS